MNGEVVEQTQPEQPPKRTYHHLYKGILCLLGIAGYLCYRFLFPQPQVACIYDIYQEATVGDNRDFVQDPAAGSAYQGNSNQLTVTGKAFIGTGQVLMDLWIAILGIIWIVKVKNVRAFGGIAGFFLTRAIIFLNIQKFPFPNNLAWRSPGFFSFTVPYDHTRDFFYSGHTGTLTIIFLEFCILNLRVPAVLSFLSLIFMMNMLLITRVHYVADIIGGLLFAIWYHRQATRAVVYIDKFLSLPFFIVKWIYVNKCNSCEEQSQKTGSSKDKNEAPISSDNNLIKKDLHMNELIQIESRRTDPSNKGRQ